MGADLLFHRRILDAAMGFGNDVAMLDVETGDTLSFADIRRKSVQLAAVLSAQFGLGRRDVLLCVLDNCFTFPVLLLAGALIGAPLSGAVPDSSQEDLEAYLAKTKCRAIFTSPGPQLELLAKKSDVLGIPLFVLDWVSGQPGTDLFALLDSSPLQTDAQINAFLANAPDTSLSLDDPFVAPLSSGASGVPKVVMQTHRNYTVMTDIVRASYFDEITASGGGRRSTIAAQPFVHTTAIWILCYCLLVGHRSLVLHKFVPSLYLSTVQRYRVDLLSLGSWLIWALLKVDMSHYDLSSVRIVIGGGTLEATDARRNREFLGRLPKVRHLLIGYGMSELVLVCHMTPLHMDPGDERRFRSVGKIMPGFEYKTVDCLSGKALNGQPFAKGELCLRSLALCNEYLGEPELRAKNFDADGWFHTGDVLYEDADGFFFVVDRVCNMIRVDGQQVWPAELETVINSHDRVLECCVLGVQDQQHGEVPLAMVVLKTTGQHQQEAEKTLLEEIKQFANVRLNECQQLRGGIVALDMDLPKTPFGKVARQKVRQLVENPKKLETIQTQVVEKADEKKVIGASKRSAGENGDDDEEETVL